MFEKVVTPSDVGKLNRLVIPKQHAEKYFPLDTSSSFSLSSDTAAATNGLLLNFEDPTGKPWRFRYSYWNSSQSYVMTKGWSRFVKDKRLDAGDTVSFGRHKDRLFIDWKHRPQNPHRIPLPLPANALNYPFVSFAPYSQISNNNYGYNVGGGKEQYLVFRSTVTPPQAVGVPMVLDSVPVVPHREVAAAATEAAKKFRLFGVNLDVPDQSSGASSPSPSPRGKEKEEPSLDLYM